MHNIYIFSLRLLSLLFVSFHPDGNTTILYARTNIVDFYEEKSKFFTELVLGRLDTSLSGLLEMKDGSQDQEQRLSLLRSTVLDSNTVEGKQLLNLVETLCHCIKASFYLNNLFLDTLPYVSFSFLLLKRNHNVL